MCPLREVIMRGVRKACMLYGSGSNSVCILLIQRVVDTDNGLTKISQYVFILGQGSKRQAWKKGDRNVDA